MGFELLFSAGGLPRDIDTSLDYLHRWLRHFDSEYYRTFGHHWGVCDLVHLKEDELIRHFVQQGWRERRSYNGFFYAFIDPDFYATRYPELDLKTPRDAIAHWMYFGVYEGRIPNGVTEEIVSAPFHLFQMGRVGSKSIQSALQAAGVNGTIPHLHWASEAIRTYPDCFLSYQEVVNHPQARTVRFISGVRDPISRLISGYCQSAGDPGSTLGALAADPDALVDRLPAFIEADYPKITDWFQHGYFRSIDVYAEPFPREQGHTVLTAGGASIFLYRFDALHRLAEPLGAFCGLDVKLGTTNDRPQAALYDRMMAQRFSRELVERIFNTRYCRHFYGEAEISKFIARYAL
jgi:hypothetical protein